MSTSQNDANATPAGDESSRQLGIVKWFNNKAGFGFVTTLEDSGKDIFVHQLLPCSVYRFNSQNKSNSIYR